MRLIEGALLAADLGARVINYSWASTTPFAVEEEMCEILEEKGVLLVCSAGHHPDNFTMYPAAYDTAFSVGATDAFDDRVEQISNEGQYVDIAAPGLFIKSCWRDADDSYIEQGSGTSYAAAFVSGAAALLLSYDPTLTPAQIRELLVETGAPTTGFAGHEVRRLDVAAAFGQLTALEIEPKRMDSLVQSGLLELSPQITGNAQWCSVSARGTELARDDSAPFALEFDTSELPDGRHELLLQCGDGEGVAEARMPILVDNSAALPELAEDFDNSMQMFMGLDSRGLSDELLARLRQFGPAGWDAADLRGSRSRVWQRSDAVGDEYAATCLLAGEPGYRSWETAVLVSRPLDLTDASNPSLRFEAACNLEEGADFLRCLATVDNGATFSELQFRGAANALLTGELAPAQYELELAGYSAEQPRIVLLLETDGSTAGEVATDPGVWIDNIELRDEGSPAAASGAAALQAWSLSGQATDDGVLSLSLPSASAVDGVIYELDLAPFGSAGGDDLRVQVTDSSSDFAVELEHAALGNRLALLRIIPFSGVQTGQLREIPLWLFNRPGDANADGQVNETDLQFIRERSAVLPDSPLWLPFADSDFDGLITELDASAVGYNWGE